MNAKLVCAFLIISIMGLPLGDSMQTKSKLAFPDLVPKMKSAVDVINTAKPPKFFFITRVRESALKKPQRELITGPGAREEAKASEEREKDFVRKEGYDNKEGLIKVKEEELGSETLKVILGHATWVESNAQVTVDFQVQPQAGGSDLYTGTASFKIMDKGLEGERLIPAQDLSLKSANTKNPEKESYPAMRQTIQGEIKSLLLNPKRKAKPPRPAPFLPADKEHEKETKFFPRECMGRGLVLPQSPFCAFMEQKAFSTVIPANKVDAANANIAKKVAEEAQNLLEADPEYVKKFNEEAKNMGGDSDPEKQKAKIQERIAPGFQPKLEELKKLVKEMSYTKELPTCENNEFEEIQTMTLVAHCLFEHVNITDTFGQNLAVMLTRAVLNQCFRKMDGDHSVPEDGQRSERLINKITMLAPSEGDLARWNKLKSNKDGQQILFGILDNGEAEKGEAAAKVICDVSRRTRMSLWSSALYSGARAWGKIITKNLLDKGENSKTAKKAGNPSHLLSTLESGDTKFIMMGMSPGK